MSINLSNFKGKQYRLVDKWFHIIEHSMMSQYPIKYLEIGAFYGANIVSFAQTYGSHPESVLYAVDPWEDYTEYPEYKGELDNIYKTFIENIENYKDKIVVKRGYSHSVVPTFEDNFFDIIYIDGNHEPEYVLEDAVISFRKLKKGGILIFDDYGWGGPDLTQRGIDAFLSGYHKQLSQHIINDGQVFVQKK